MLPEPAPQRRSALTVRLPLRHLRALPPAVAVQADVPDAERRIWRSRLALTDAAWVTVRPPETHDTLAPLSQDLLTAIGNVGLTQGRMVGERHLLRAFPYLVDSGIRDLVVDDAQLLPEPVLDHLLTVCLAAAVRVWLLIEPPLLGAQPEMFQDRCGGLTSWPEATARWSALQPTRCLQHPEAVLQSWEDPDRFGSHPVACFVSAMRAATTSGRLGRVDGRDLVQRALDSPTVTAPDVWLLYGLGRDTYTPALAVLRSCLPPWASLCKVELQHVAQDGSHVEWEDLRYAVPAEQQAALRRQRLSNAIFHGPGDYPYLSILGELPRSHSDQAVTRTHRGQAVAGSGS